MTQFESKIWICQYNNKSLDNFSIVPVDPTVPLLIGNDVYYNGTFDGYIKEITVWRKALKNYQVKILYKNLYKLNSLYGLISYYPMDEKEGNMIYDKVNGANGILQGAHWRQV